MEMECLNTRFPGSLCLYADMCAVQLEAKKDIYYFIVKTFLFVFNYTKIRRHVKNMISNNNRCVIVLKKE